MIRVYLAKWRPPLSLINADAKSFPKILANRFNRVLPCLINPYQTGFMPFRYISDNGWVNQTLMANHCHCGVSSNAVAVLSWIKKRRMIVCTLIAFAMCLKDLVFQTT